MPWLRSHLFGAVEGYARGIKVDTAKLEDVVGQLDPQNPEQLQDALQQGMFQPEDAPEQKAALARLETALALVEGWVDAVVHAAAKPRLSSAATALRETLRRRRATGGPAEQTFATLIGLELRPRRLRDASRLWASLTDARGVDGRDGLWAHPDMLPTASDLDDPDGFVHREQLDFSEIDKMLGEAASGSAEKTNLKKDDVPRTRTRTTTRATAPSDPSRRRRPRTEAVRGPGVAAPGLSGPSVRASRRHVEGLHGGARHGQRPGHRPGRRPRPADAAPQAGDAGCRWAATASRAIPTLAAAALREATEESGIEGLILLPGGPVALDRHAIPAPCNWHLDVQYAALAPGRGRGGDQRNSSPWTCAGSPTRRSRTWRRPRSYGSWKQPAHDSRPEARVARVRGDRHGDRPLRSFPGPSPGRLTAGRSTDVGSGRSADHRRGQLQTLPWFCARAPCSCPMPYWARSPCPITAFWRQQLAGLDEREALAQEAELPASTWRRPAAATSPQESGLELILDMRQAGRWTEATIPSASSQLTTRPA